MAHTGCTIGIDIGTSSVKAIAFDAHMQEIAHAAEEVKSHHDDAGAAEQEPGVVYSSVVHVLTRASQEAQRLGFTLERVGLSAAMHSLIPVAADGTPLGPYDTAAQTDVDAQTPTGNLPEGSKIRFAERVDLVSMVWRVVC